MKRDHKRLSDQIIPILQRVFSEQQSSSNPGMTFLYGNTAWTLTPEESRLFHNAVLAVSSSFPKVHKKTCEKELKKFCCEKIPSHGVSFEQSIPSFIQALDRLSEIENVVFVQVSGLLLKVDDFEIGSIKFANSENSDANEFRLRIKDLNGLHPDPIESGKTLAKLKVWGEPEFAKEVATSRVQEALDCLQALSIQLNPAAFCNDIGFDLSCSEPVPNVNRLTWTYSSIEPTWYSDASPSTIIPTKNPACNLLINPDTVSKIGPQNLARMSELLSTTNLSPFDEGLLASLMWIARAIRERDLTQKFLAFYIALEALFTRDYQATRKSPDYSTPATTTDEGVAFLLGKSVTERTKIAKRVRELSRTRNMIVHRGYSEVEWDDLLLLASYSWHCSIRALELRTQFHQENSFRDWCQNLRFWTPTDTSEEQDRISGETNI